MRRLTTWLLVGSALLCCVTASFGWGQEGHSIIAELAQRRLSPEASAAIAKLLGKNVSLASVASWADDVRDARPETYNWHFVDIPKAKTDYVEARDCAASDAGDCVVKELTRLKRDLRCAPTDAAKVEALKFAVHFVGDIHQPLHAVGDLKGGNGVPVHGSMHGPTCKTGTCSIASGTSLHSLWDSSLIKLTVYDWGAYVDRLESGLMKTQEFQLRVKNETPVDWALQSHAVARLVWNEKLVPADGTLDDKYYKAALPFLDQQLALGGMRLAGFLNQAFSSTDCSENALAATEPTEGAETGLRAFKNVGEMKQEVYAYHNVPRENGQTGYAFDQATVGSAATAYIVARAGSATNPAITLDIDETSLDNWKQLAANDLGYIPNGLCDFAKGFVCGSLAWDESAAAPAVSSTLALFNAVRAKGVAVIFITGRHEAERAATLKNLTAAGYSGWADLVMRPDGEFGPAADYKASARAALFAQGYTVLANVGDQPSDLAGGYSEMAFLMPNPFYRIP